MKQKFYKKNYGDERWYVFMGNKAMEEIGGGLLIANVGHEEAADTIITEYTNRLNDMIAAEECQITESL